MRRLAIAVACLLLAARTTHAQAVRGRVITRDSAGVAGAIVTLLDSAGTPLARALADDAGRFAMRMPAAGRYGVQVPRLGFAPTMERPFRVGDGEVVERSPNGDTYNAPDEEVLLSHSFAETHCLKLLPASGGPGLVRLVFIPVPERRLPDIRGVLTVDCATNELRGSSSIT